MLQKHLPQAKVVKAFNVIASFQLLSDVKKKGTKGRRALPIAGDDTEAKKVVRDLIDEFGYDVVDLGPLPQSKFSQTGALSPSLSPSLSDFPFPFSFSFSPSFFPFALRSSNSSSSLFFLFVLFSYL